MSNWDPCAFYTRSRFVSIKYFIFQDGGWLRFEGSILYNFFLTCYGSKMVFRRYFSILILLFFTLFYLGASEDKDVVKCDDLLDGQYPCWFSLLLNCRRCFVILLCLYCFRLACSIYCMCLALDCAYIPMWWASYRLQDPVCCWMQRKPHCERYVSLVFSYSLRWLNLRLYLVIRQVKS